ncbi:hypothetical protein GLOIN_2v1842500 [Rhizophagus irregularis DAOM 181602=DAOM 197198]|uniref:Uncharacterized protein n=1 Tax=Rhizophagus irregularis (strain DAOM 181602 / DAOM 197198 / MUCL 43194) TaxID=747089 RepID=U9TTV9_RHIID|nr:hypothetical protein GLOIN_2v1842500 [Rhizophagus irregularis DAOM 181602=DAOM 197198]
MSSCHCPGIMYPMYPNHLPRHKNRNCFKRVFDSNKEEGETLDYVFETIRREIRQLTVKNFYCGGGYPKFRIIISIMRRKEFSDSLDNNKK